MTRKGARQEHWTTGQVRYLLENAGVLSRREICRHLRKSGEAVKQKAKILRAKGYAIDLRHYEPLTVICPSCGEARSKEGRWRETTGICDVCRMRDQLRDAQYRQAKAYASLTAEQRQVYDRTQAQVGDSGLPPRPTAPRTAGLAPNKAQRLRELHAIDVERWEKACLRRQINAAKTRTKRMREKSGTNPRKGAGGSPRE